MFIVERPGLRLTRTFYVFVAVVVVLTGSVAVLVTLFTMHLHISSRRIAPPRQRRAPNPANIPECDLPPLPNREGPFDYKGHRYYLYPNGDVDGFAGRAWWRVPLGEFKRHVDRVTARDR
jgi:hypothetical protein